MIILGYSVTIFFKARKFIFMGEKFIFMGEKNPRRGNKITEAQFFFGGTDRFRLQTFMELVPPRPHTLTTS